MASKTYHYSVYDRESGAYQNYESCEAPSLVIRYDDLPFQVLDNFAIPLPQQAYYTGMTELPAGPDAIIASWTEREFNQPAQPEQAADEGAFLLRSAVAVFLGGMVVNSYLESTKR